MRYYTNEQNQSCDESFCLMFILWIKYKFYVIKKTILNLYTSFYVFFSPSMLLVN
jgi:hypothetical protein